MIKSKPCNSERSTLAEQMDNCKICTTFKNTRNQYSSSTTSLSLSLYLNNSFPEMKQKHNFKNQTLSFHRTLEVVQKKNQAPVLDCKLARDKDQHKTSNLSIWIPPKLITEINTYLITLTQQKPVMVWFCVSHRNYTADSSKYRSLVGEFSDQHREMMMMLGQRNSSRITKSMGKSRTRYLSLRHSSSKFTLFVFSAPFRIFPEN